MRACVCVWLRHIAVPFVAQTSGTEQGTLAEAIFVELNKAYALFEESGAYGLY